MSRACAWCGRSDGELQTIIVELPDRLTISTQEQSLTVHPEHETSMRSYAARIRTHGRRFLILVGLLGGLAPLLGTLLLIVQLGVGLAIIGSAVFALGIVLFAYPFATPETIQFTGVKTARVLVRGAAVLVTGLGIWILILGFQI